MQGRRPREGEVGGVGGGQVASRRLAWVMASVAVARCGRGRHFAMQCKGREITLQEERAVACNLLVVMRCFTGHINDRNELSAL